MAELYEVQVDDSVIYQGKRCAVRDIDRDVPLILEGQPGGEIYERVKPREFGLWTTSTRSATD